MSKKRKLASSYEFVFRFPIGDWSNDGHGRCEYFKLLSNKPKKDILNALKKAKRLQPDLDFKWVCAEYEDSKIDENVKAAAEKLGFEFEGLDRNDDYMTKELMAEYVAWYVMLGDEDLKLKVDFESKEDVIYELNAGYGLFH